MPRHWRDDQHLRLRDAHLLAEAEQGGEGRGVDGFFDHRHRLASHHDAPDLPGRPSVRHLGQLEHLAGGGRLAVCRRPAAALAVNLEEGQRQPGQGAYGPHQVAVGLVRLIHHGVGRLMVVRWGEQLVRQR